MSFMRIWQLSSDICELIYYVCIAWLICSADPIPSVCRCMIDAYPP